MKSCGVATDRGEHVYVAHDRGLEPGSYTPPPRNFSAAHIQRFKPGAWLPTGVSPTPQVWPYTGTMFGLPLAQRQWRSTGLPDRLQQRRRPVLQRVPKPGSAGCSTKSPVYRAPHEYFNNLPGPNVETVDDGSTYFAVDQATDDVYFDQESVVVRRDEAGNTLESFGPVGFSLGIAVNSTNGTVYVTDAFSATVLVYKTTEAPDVSYDPPTAGATTASSLRDRRHRRRRQRDQLQSRMGYDHRLFVAAETVHPGRRRDALLRPSTPVTAKLTGLNQESDLPLQDLRHQRQRHHTRLR